MANYYVNHPDHLAYTIKLLLSHISLILKSQMFNKRISEKKNQNEFIVEDKFLFDFGDYCQLPVEEIHRTKSFLIKKLVSFLIDENNDGYKIGVLPNVVPPNSIEPLLNTLNEIITHH